MNNWKELAELLVENEVAPKGIQNREVLNAMKRTPRHLFVSQLSIEEAYMDQPYAIGEDQTISQPYMVAKMTELLNLQAGDKVLEIGTGSGYQAAVLCSMGMKVTTVERIENLAMKARSVFALLKMDICSIISDGRAGYLTNAPYKGILVTAAASKVENSWLEQLEVGGKIVLPMKILDGISQLKVICKNGRNKYSEETYDYCRFVPMLKGIKKKKE